MHRTLTRLEQVDVRLHGVPPVLFNVGRELRIVFGNGTAQGVESQFVQSRRNVKEITIMPHGEAFDFFTKPSLTLAEQDHDQ